MGRTLSNTNTLLLKSLLPHQQAIRNNAGRFNVICAGRRAGKTGLFEDLAFDPDNMDNGAVNGFPVAVFSPTYKMMGEVWRELMITARPVASHIDKVEKRIEMPGGGSIDFWSLDNIDSMRGRKYKRILIDEAVIIRELMTAWNASIRPLLVDLKGDAWFFSTPKPPPNDFFDLFNYAQEGKKDWKSFRFRTIDNPVIDPEEIEEARKTLPAHIFMQEFEGEFVNDNITSWLYAFDENRHIEDQIASLREFPVYVAVDFNNDPLEATVWQISPTLGREGSFIHCINSFSVRSKVDELGRMIRSEYPMHIMYLCGDASGQNEDVGRYQTLYQIMAGAMGIGKKQIILNKKNLQYSDSRMLCNTMLQNYPRFKIAKDKCGELIKQMTKAVVDTDSDIPGKLKKDRASYKLDMFDSYRYFMQTFFLKFAQRNYYRSLVGKTV